MEVKQLLRSFLTSRKNNPILTADELDSVDEFMQIILSLEERLYNLPVKYREDIISVDYTKMRDALFLSNNWITKNGHYWHFKHGTRTIGEAYLLLMKNKETESLVEST